MLTSTKFVCTKNNNELLQTDTDILMSILPSNVWAETFKILEEKNPSSLENLSNSSLYFRNLALSKRVLFLFPSAFKLIGSKFANQVTTQKECSNIIKCRTISKSWRKGVDQFITDGPPFHQDFFNEDYSQRSDHALVNARYQYFGHRKPTKITQFLTHFQQTHFPHDQRNPFIGNVVYIDLTDYADQTQWASIEDQVSTLLRKYGHHIRILNLAFFKYHPQPSIQIQKHSWLLEWLENCPNLTHLKFSERHGLNDDLDIPFGSRPDPERIRMLQGIRPEQQNIDFNYMMEYLRRFQCNYRMEDTRRMNTHLKENNRRLSAQIHASLAAAREVRQPAVSLVCQENLEPLFSSRNGNHRDGGRPQSRKSRLFHLREALRNAKPEPIPLVVPIADHTVSQPTLKNLQCLKLSHVSALNFNSLISANIHVTWLQIEPLEIENHMYIDYIALEFPNLVKLYLKLCSPEKVSKLKDIHQSWLSLTHLHFEYCMSELCSFSPEFMEWVKIFEVISQNWRTTLTDLKLKLPKAKTEHEKAKVLRDSEHARLYLPNLKRLKIWLNDESGEMVAKTTFLDLMNVKLEQLIIE